MNPINILTARRPWIWWCLAGLAIAYALACVIIFFQWVNPSLEGTTSQRIAADSFTYLYMADALREGRKKQLHSRIPHCDKISRFQRRANIRNLSKL
jgi:hypothetical protein